MAVNKEYDEVQLDVEFTQASTRENLVSKENISISFGKISKYFADLHSQAFTGYTHPTYTARTGKPTGNQTPGFGSTFTISQITSDGTGHVTAATDRTVKIPNTTMGAATADAAGSIGLVPAPAAGKQTSFLRGDGTWVVPTNTNTTYTLSGAYGSSSNTWVTTLTPSSGNATTSTVPTASTSVYGITKLSSATNSTSTALAATPSAVKSAYDLANGKSTVSFSASLTSGTKVGTITIDGTATDIYCSTVNNAALTLKGAGTTVTTFTANASSAKSLDIVAGSNVTVTADATNSKISIASSHPTITKSTDTTSTASPAHGGTFTTVDSVTRDGNGHVTKINTKTVTLPADSNTDTKVSQTLATADNNRPLLMSYYLTGETTTTAQVVHRNDALYFNPSSGVLRSPRLYLQTTYMPITINLDTLQPTAGENVNVMAVQYKNTGGTATHTVYPIGILGNNATGDSATYNSGVRLGSTNGTTIVSAGESGVTLAAAQAKYNDENLYFVADDAVYMYTSCNNNSTTVTGPWRVGGFTTGTSAITSGRVMITDGTTGGFKASDYTIAKSVPSDAKFSDTTYSAGNHLTLSSTTFKVADYCKNLNGGDWNTATTNGWYMGASCTNAPDSNWWMGRVVAHNNKYCIQEVWNFNVSAPDNDNPDAMYMSHKRRWFRGENWGPWVDVSTPTPSEKVNCDFGTVASRTTNVTRGWIAHWDGAYKGTSSNLTYCNRGAFGTIVTKNAEDYSLSTHTHDSLYGAQSSSAVPVTTLVNGRLKVFYNVNTGLSGNMPATNNANAIIQINKHGGDYDSQLGFSSNGNIYYRSCNGTALSASMPWKRIYDTSNPPTASEVGALASTTNYAGSSSAGGPALSVSTAGGDVVLGTPSSSSDDSGDILWKYGNGQEKARLWQDNTYTAKAGPTYRIYKSDGTSLYNGRLPLADGTSASGTWGISITGNASTSTKTTQDGDGNTISSTYLKLSGGTMTGAVNFANNTMNKLGDDVQFGDGNVSGHMIVQGLNNTTGINLKYASDSYTGCNMTVTTKSQANSQFIGLYNHDEYGTGVVLGGGTGGLMALGGGESPMNFHSIMGSASTNPLGVAWHDGTENTIITADAGIYFMSGAYNLGSSTHTDWTHCKTIVLDTSGNFNPTITNKGSVGTSSKYWATSYITTMYGQHKRSEGGEWISARTNAAVWSNSNSVTDDSFYPATFSKTKSGGWAIGTLGKYDSLIFSYTTDTDFSSGANTSTYTIYLPEASGTVALTSKTFNVTRGSSVSTATAGYWAAMCSSSSTGSPVLPTSGKWWHVISMDWRDNNDTKNWISQLAIATQDGSGVWWRRNDTGGTSIDSFSWNRLAEGDSSGAANSSNVLNSNTRMDYGWNGVNYFNISSATAGNAAKVNDTPTAAWWHIMRFNHANSAGYYTDLAIPFNDTSLYYKRITQGSVQNGGWVKVLDALNIGYVMSSSVIKYDPHARRFTSSKTDKTWNAQAYSNTGYADNVYVSFRPGQTTMYAMIGLDANPSEDANYNKIDYCWYICNGGTMQVYESGNAVTITGHTTYASGDEFRVEYSCGEIRYYHNGTLCRSVTRAVSEKLFFDSSFHDAGNVYDFSYGTSTHSTHTAQIITSTYKSSTYVTSLTDSVITLSDAASSFGGWICGPTKNGRIAISSYQGYDDKLYFGYGERGRTANSYVKAMTWDGPTNTLTADKFVGALQGNADTSTTATKAAQDESGNNIKATYAASFSISDHTITLKNKNGGSLGTVTVPDNNTTQTNTTTNADYRVLFSTNANDTTQSGTTRKNINLQYNPSTATLKIGDFVSSSTATKNGKLVFGNSSNVYTHTINTNADKLGNVSLTLNSTDGIMGTDALCYKGYESANLASDTVPGSLADISSLSNAVSFSGYLARFSYFTVLLCVGTDVTARTTVQVSAIAGYQSYQLIWGGAPNHSGGNLSITSGLVNITESSGTITLNFGKCASYWQFSSSSSTPTKGTTPNIHVLKVYGHCIRSNGYH